MTVKKVRWILQEHKDETFDVLRAGRRMRHHLSLGVALEYLKKQKKANDVVFREAPDGYRTKLSGRR